MPAAQHPFRGAFGFLALPVVECHLRRSSRLASTYWMRSGVAAVGMLAVIVVMLATRQQTSLSAQAGQTLAAVLAPSWLCLGGLILFVAVGQPATTAGLIFTVWLCWLLVGVGIDVVACRGRTALLRDGFQRLAAGDTVRLADGVRISAHGAAEA